MGIGEKTKMRKLGLMVSILVAMVWTIGISTSFVANAKPASEPNGFAGSVSCRKCHEKFYKLWSTSFHGLAMQPYTSDFARIRRTGGVTLWVTGTASLLAKGALEELGIKVAERVDQKIDLVD